MTTALTPSVDNPPAGARPFASFQMRADVRLFQTTQHLACQEDPELFFNPRTKHRAIKRCNDCPFRAAAATTPWPPAPPMESGAE